MVELSPYENLPPGLRAITDYAERLEEEVHRLRAEKEKQ
jgi:hypothetical protein